jgi:hypothetical protein
MTEKIVKYTSHRSGSGPDRKTDEKRIILPGDPGWNTPAALDPAPVTPKLPDEVLEAAFSEVVNEVKDKLATTSEEAPAAATPKEPEPPKASYRFHSPARNKSIPIPMPKPIVVTLTENLPRSWERKCYVGGTDYLPIEGKDYKQRVRRPGFRKGEAITLSSMVFYPGIGVLYGFEEGSRGGYAVRQEQIHFPEPVSETPAPGPGPAPEVQSNSEVAPNAAMDGQDPQV